MNSEHIHITCSMAGDGGVTLTVHGWYSWKTKTLGKIEIWDDQYQLSGGDYDNNLRRAKALLWKTIRERAKKK